MKISKNNKKILSLVLFLLIAFVGLPLYFTSDYKILPNKSVESKKETWVTEQKPNFEKIGTKKAKEYLISTSDVRASEIGSKILAKGGNAIDAIIAAQMVLNVVEPQSSGIGGGAFLIYFDAKTKKTYYFNGRETAPMAANSEIFLQKDHKTTKLFPDAVKGGLSVGTPSLLKMLKLVHEKYGKLPWEELFAESIKIAQDGFPMDKRIQESLKELAYLKEFDSFSKLYLKADKTPKNIGEIIKNPDLAKTLTIISKEGITPFYEGKIANNIVEKVTKSKINPGFLSLDDLKNYKVKEADLLCSNYRKYKVCSVPLPSSGGITLLATLGILENFELKNYLPSSAGAVHLITEATKLAYADRNKYIGDVKDVPVSEMLDKEYLKERSELIKMDSTLKNVTPGEFTGFDLYAFDKASNENPSTTHLSVIDKEGNAISMTSSIEYAFGSALVVDGFLLNNQLTDFSFVPEINGKKVANALEPGKQPRSSMAPTFVFDEAGNLILVLGSPGGPNIIQYVLKTIIAHLDWNLGIQRAITLPNFVVNKDIIELEKGTQLEKISPELIKLGHKVDIKKISSGINAINIDLKDHYLIGGADLRRNGIAVGK